MPGWRKEIDFKPFWNDDSMPIDKKGEAAAAEIKRVFPNHEELPELSEIIEEFEVGVEETLLNLTQENAVEQFDCAMEMLYNYADRERIWVATNF